MFKSILLIAGVVCLFLAGFSVTVSRINFGWLGLACLAAALYLPL